MTARSLGFSVEGLRAGQVWRVGWRKDSDPTLDPAVRKLQE